MNTYINPQAIENKSITKDKLSDDLIFDIKGEIPKNEIWYTSSDDNIVTPNDVSAFSGSIVSNTYKNGKGVIVFDGDVISIGNDAFFNCSSLTSVTISDSVTSIGEWAFGGCTSLESITIPDSVISIGEDAFINCGSLTSVTIPDSVTSIRFETFRDCPALTSVIIGNSVTWIGDDAFYLCPALTSVTIGNSVTEIGRNAFFGCTSLTSVTIPDSVTSIGREAFSGCSPLTSVTIPDSVTSIGEGAFGWCTSLTSVYCKPTTPPTGGEEIFNDYNSSLKIYVPINSLDAYKSATNWSQYADNMVGVVFEDENLVSGQNIKTINGVDILGGGDITINIPSDISIPVIVKGDANNSAILKGEYNGYSNEAISQVSTSFGAASTAGLKGWYYTKVNFSENLIWLSETRTTQTILGIGRIKIDTTTSTTADNKSFVCGWEVGDEVTIVNDKKYDRCAKITAINGNMIKLDKLPFDNNSIVKESYGAEGLFEPDEFSITAIRITDDNTLKTRSVSSHDKGKVDFGGGAMAEGVQTYALNIGAHSEGINTIAYGQYSHAEGFKTEAGYSAHAEGKETSAVGNQSHAEGQNTIANGNNSHVEGYGSVTGYISEDGTEYSGAKSHAEGENTIAARGSHAEGISTIAYGWQSHAEGKETIAHGSFSHTEGVTSIAAGSAAHAEGNQTKALGNAAHAEGYMTEATELYAHAEGNQTKATGKYSHTEGYMTEATTNNAHAEGNQTKAQGNSAHAEGKLTVASKDFSHAGGLSSTASGIGSFAHGNYVTATKDYEIAFGKFNVSNEDTVFSIGNGTDENSRSNILEIKNTSGEIGVNYQAPKTDIFFSADVHAARPTIDNTTVLVITYVSSNSDYATYKITYVNESNYIIQGYQEYIYSYDSTEHLILSVGDLLYVPIKEKPSWESEYTDEDSEDKIIAYVDLRCMYINTSFTKNNAIRIVNGNYDPGLVRLIESANSSLFVNGTRVLIENDEYINNTKSEILAESISYTDNKFNNIDIDINIPLQATTNGGIITINDDGVRSNVASGKSSFAMGGYVADSGNKYDGCNAIGAASFSGGVNNYSNGICSFTYGFGLNTTTASSKYGETAFGKYNKSETNTLFSIGYGTSEKNRKNTFEIKTNGKHYIYGVGGYNGTNPNDTNDVATVLSNVSKNVVEIDYNELKSLRDNSKLVPGEYYRITDYVTTTIQNNTQSAEKLFDVIVLALNENTLSEEAYAINSERDDIGYFSNSNLSAWKLWYCLDNDPSRFGWADESNGKGVIYRMIDEFGNDCPYDFKNIQFRRDISFNSEGLKISNGGIDYVYTFCFVGYLYKYNDIMADSDGTTSSNYDNIELGDMEDGSLYPKVHNNVMKPCHSVVMDDELYRDPNILYLNDNVISSCWEFNADDGGCYNNTLGFNCCNNSFDSNCHSNTLGNDCCNNTFGFDCCYNVLNDNCEYKHISKSNQIEIQEGVLKVGHIIINGNNDIITGLENVVTNTITTNNDALVGGKLNITGLVTASSDMVAAGTITALGFHQSSDERLKTFTSDYDINLDDIKNIKTGKFYWNSDESRTINGGVSAQTVEEYFPELVKEDETGMKSVNYDGLAVVAIAAIKKLTERIEQLEEIVRNK